MIKFLNCLSLHKVRKREVLKYNNLHYANISTIKIFFSCLSVSEYKILSITIIIIKNEGLKCLSFLLITINYFDKLKFEIWNLIIITINCMSKQLINGEKKIYIFTTFDFLLLVTCNFYVSKQVFIISLKWASKIFL